MELEVLIHTKQRGTENRIIPVLQGEIQGIQVLIIAMLEGSVAQIEKFASNRGVGSPHPTPNNCY